MLFFFFFFTALKDVVLMFQYLNVSGSGTLSWNEFQNVYDATVLTWEAQYSSIPRYQAAFAAISYPHFGTFIYSLVIGNGLAMIWRLFQSEPNLAKSAHLFAASWDTLFFVALFALEALIKVLGLGVRRYLSSGWNLFDLGTSTMALVAAVGLTLFPKAVFFVVFRPLCLLRLFKVKKRYRDVFGTLVILSPLMCSTAIVMLVLYYFFAIIGMELFAGYDMKNCCINTTVEDFYKYSANESAKATLGYYYLNTFDNLMASFMTLFELTVVNNWFILMNAYAVTVSTYTRAYFMIFYLITMIVLTIVVSSFLEAFRFRIQYKKSTTKHDGKYNIAKIVFIIDNCCKYFNNFFNITEEKMLHEQVELNWEDWRLLIQDNPQLNEQISDFLQPGATNTRIFIGSRPRTREILQRKMYTQEIDEWLSEAKAHDDKDTTHRAFDVEVQTATSPNEINLTRRRS